ncbi:MAG TPA: ABC transporter permease, partial [Bacteroidota bacterium]|nr:ABC transporter permease [Bacteroidota bacterium]
MITHFLRIIVRNFVRAKIYTLINIGGLAVGMACFLLVLFYVRFEQSYDDFHRNGDRIYRVLRESTTDTYTEKRSNTGPPVAPILLNNFPGIRQV